MQQSSEEGRDRDSERVCTFELGFHRVCSNWICSWGDQMESRSCGGEIHVVVMLFADISLQ